MMELDREVAQRFEFAGMVGRGPAMQEVFDLIRRLAPHVRTALDLGRDRARARSWSRGRCTRPVRAARGGSSPSTARRWSRRCSNRSSSGTCAAPSPAPPTSKAGLFETADGGTLFLDEIGELPPTLQAKLLRVLETGEVQRVGSLQPVKTDVRVVCATQPRSQRRGRWPARFRSDLLYRLNVVQIALPALRDRREDIPVSRSPRSSGTSASASASRSPACRSPPSAC